MAWVISKGLHVAAQFAAARMASVYKSSPSWVKRMGELFDQSDMDKNGYTSLLKTLKPGVTVLKKNWAQKGILLFWQKHAKPVEHTGRVQAWNQESS